MNQFYTKKGWIELDNSVFPQNPKSGDVAIIDNLQFTYDHPEYQTPKTWVITKEN